MKTLPANLIQDLIPLLPRYAEEEGDFFSVERINIIQGLITEGYVEEIAKTTLAMLENLLDTLATLDSESLQKGEWCFISFPAQLMALSVLTAMSDQDSRFFKPNFWNTQGISNNKKEQQLDVLKHIETQRFESHSKKEAKPIRYIHVAWSIIKHHGEILFYQREDTKKRHDTQAGDYGLIGGRVNQNDMPILANEVDARLQALQSDKLDLIKPALETTLKRELQEETGLIYGEHYDFKLWRELKPYQQVQGSAPNHALTEYFFNLYTIELTLAGFCFLQKRVKQDDELAWFSISDILKGKRDDGKLAYIKALHADFDNKDLLKKALENVNDSFDSNYNLTQKNDTLTLPDRVEKNILAGSLGKEFPLDVALSQEQQELLLGLAAHSRGFEFENRLNDVLFYPYGWIKINEGSHLQAPLIQLAQQLNAQKPLVIENQKDCYFRLSVLPKNIYFYDDLFSISLLQNDLNGIRTKVRCWLKRSAFITAFGRTTEVTQQKTISLELADDLQKCTSNTYSDDNDFAMKTKDKYRKALHKDFKSLGMRGLLRQEANTIKTLCKLEIINN